MLNSINYKNITFLANIEIAIDSFEEISREENSNNIDNGVVIDDIVRDIIYDKLNEIESINKGFNSSKSYLVSLVKVIRAFLKANLSIDQLIK